MAVSKRIRTDLALETTERFKEENTEIRGVEIQEDYDEEKDVRTTVVRIVTENGAKAMGRPQGTYITIESPDLSVPDEDYHREISEEISKHLKQLIDLKKEKSILVVGLGNAGITADALGPHVVENLRMTRHIIREYGLRGIDHEKMHRVSGIVPGVMAQTGMETAEIIQGVVAETKPDVVVAIDALEEAEQKEFLEEMIAPNLYSMFVTPKDVDETVKYLSFTISEGLNTAFGEA